MKNHPPRVRGSGGGPLLAAAQGRGISGWRGWREAWDGGMAGVAGGVEDADLGMAEGSLPFHPPSLFSPYNSCRFNNNNIRSNSIDNINYNNFNDINNNN